MSSRETSSADLVLPRSDEPPDFRRQATSYGRFRRDYSPALYDAIGQRTGAASGRRALDLGCGTGFVSAQLQRRGWRVVGADFSTPMLAEARQFLGGDASLVRARAESLPLSSDAVGLITCGTSFHWFAPRPALAEIERVVAPGGWVALFWRYPSREAITPRIIREVLARFGVQLPDEHFVVHPPEPFLGSGLEAAEPLLIPTTLEFTPAEFHGYAATTELLRRFAGAHHADFLAALRDELEHRFAGGLVESNEEHLFLARRR